jgi:hypothetical protein
MLQARRPRFQFLIKFLGILIVVILPAALCCSGWQSIKQRWVTGIFPSVTGGRCLRLTTSAPSVSRFCTTCESHDVSMVWVSTACYRDSYILHFLGCYAFWCGGYLRVFVMKLLFPSPLRNIIWASKQVSNQGNEQVYSSPKCLQISTRGLCSHVRRDCIPFIQTAVEKWDLT